MTLLKNLILTSSLLFSASAALAQVEGSIGRPGDGYHGGPGGGINQPDHQYPGNDYPDDYRPDHHPGAPGHPPGRPYPPPRRPGPHPRPPYPGDGHRHPRPPPHYPNEQIIECYSYGYNVNQCFVGGYGQIIDVQLIGVRSRNACHFQYNWGYNYDSIWVSNGCQGVFRVFKDYGRGYNPGRGHGSIGIPPRGHGR